MLATARRRRRCGGGAKSHLTVAAVVSFHSTALQCHKEVWTYKAECANSFVIGYMQYSCFYFKNQLVNVGVLITFQCFRLNLVHRLRYLRLIGEKCSSYA